MGRKGIFQLIICAVLVFDNPSPLFAQWISVNTGLTNTNVQALTVSGTNLFAGTGGGGVFLSTNSGISWIAVSTGLTNTNVQALTVSGTNLFAGTGGGVFLSTNNGTSWTPSLTNTNVVALAALDTNIFAGTRGKGVYRSTNNGTSWTQVNTGMTNIYVPALAVSDTNIFAGTFGSGVYRSTNNCTSWTQAGLYPGYIEDLVFSGANLFAGDDERGVYLSTDNGASWTRLYGTNTFVTALAVSGTNLFAGTRGGVELSTNNGTSWATVNTGFPYFRPVPRCFAVSATDLLAGFIDGLFRRPLSEMITSVKTLSTYLPMEFSLRQNHPNPFNPTTTIDFHIPVRCEVIIRVVDMLGKEVAVLANGQLSSGAYSTEWNATGVASGIYYYQLRAGDFVQTKKLVLMK